VEVEAFKEEDGIIRIRAVIVVARDTQKSIIIGKGGSAIKKVGTEARKDMEKYFGKKIFLETFVKVDKDWRNDDRKLRKYGY
jgi:GTP-binding protein Era